jgi:CheY-like chemotaxis protein
MGKECRARKSRADRLAKCGKRGAAMSRILVVDDESRIRMLLNTILSRKGYEVEEAPEGAAAIRLCREKDYDLVIMDLIMPEQEGLETIMQLRREKPDLPVIAISGGGKTGNLDFLNTALKLGAQRAISKPFSNQEILDNVSELLDS